jgi:hypothetical protein
VEKIQGYGRSTAELKRKVNQDEPWRFESYTTEPDENVE